MLWYPAPTTTSTYRGRCLVISACFRSFYCMAGQTAKSIINVDFTGAAPNAASRKRPISFPAMQMSSLRNNDMLRTLSFRHNKLNTATASALGHILLHNTTLRSLDLSWNALGPAAGVSLAKGVIYNATLRVCFCCLSVAQLHTFNGWHTAQWHIRVIAPLYHCLSCTPDFSVVECIQRTTMQCAKV